MKFYEKAKEIRKQARAFGKIYGICKYLNKEPVNYDVIALLPNLDYCFGESPINRLAEIVSSTRAAGMSQYYTDLIQQLLDSITDEHFQKPLNPYTIEIVKIGAEEGEEEAEAQGIIFFTNAMFDPTDTI